MESPPCRAGLSSETDGADQAVREQQRRAGLSWSAETLDNIRNHLLPALKDFGVLCGSRRKRACRPEPGSPVAIFAAILGPRESDDRSLNLMGLRRDPQLPGW